jgi:hypothetical protein
MTARLTIRRALSDEQGTLGVVFVGGEFFCFSIELPWRFNAREISCFPAGQYRLLYTMSPRLRIRTYEVVDVPNRSGIRIHSGNVAGDKIRGWDSHSLGCPLFGERQGSLKNSAGRAQRAVLLSRSAIRRMETALGRREGVLEVVDVA